MDTTDSKPSSSGKQATANEHKTGASKLLEKKQYLLELQEQLDAEKALFAEKASSAEASKQAFEKQEEVFKQKEEQLRRRDAEFEESLVVFSKYLQENDAKRARALKKAADERRICEEKSAEAKKLADTADRVKAEVTEAHEIVTRNSRHQEYLEAVIEQRETFQDIAEVIARHATLTFTNDDLRRQQQQAARETEQVRLETQAQAKAKAEIILAASAKISKLKKEIEEEHHAAVALERQHITNAAKAVQQTLERSQVQLAAKHLYQRCIEHSKIAHGAHPDTKSQLMTIAQFISDHQHIFHQHNHHHHHRHKHST